MKPLIKLGMVSFLSSRQAPQSPDALVGQLVSLSTLCDTYGKNCPFSLSVLHGQTDEVSLHLSLDSPQITQSRPSVSPPKLDTSLPNRLRPESLKKGHNNIQYEVN